MFLSAILSFLGGSTFRLVWGEISSFITKQQDHAQQLELMTLQATLDDKKAERDAANIKLQHELNVQQVMLETTEAEEKGASDAFTAAMENAFKPTGIVLVDAWNGVVRPAFATVCLVLWTLKLYVQGWKMDEWDMGLLGGIVGFFFADRGLVKRGK